MKVIDCLQLHPWGNCYLHSHLAFLPVLFGGSPKVILWRRLAANLGVFFFGKAIPPIVVKPLIGKGVVATAANVSI